MRKRFLVLSLVLISVLMACTFVACSGGTGGRCSGGHTWADHTTLVEATCTTPGSVLQQCSVCGIKREASVSALGHKLEIEPGSAIDPTCTTDGYTGTQACVNNGCSYSVQGSVIPAIQHAYGVWVSLGDGTHKRVCGNDNSHVEIESCSGGTADCGTKAKCDICGGEYGEVSTEHVFDKQVVDEKYLASPATCTSKATYYFSCKCGTKGTETFESGDILPHVYDQKNTDAKYLKHAANCISGAEYYLSCACGHLDKATAGTFSDGVPTGEHVFDREVAEEKYLATPATCTSKAQYHYSCECGEEGTTTFEYGNLLAHSMTHHQAVPATCVATGFVEYWTCSSCGFNYDTAQGGTVLGSLVEQINPNNHVNTSVTVSEIAPTCTAEGRTANLYCDDCNKEVIASTVVDALGHIGGTATCTDKAVCDRCDQPYGDLAGHAFGNWTSNGNDTHSRVCANDASHTETVPCSGGTATPTSKAICDVCGKEYGSFAEIPTGQVTIVTMIGDYATANGWEKGTRYETVNLDAIVFATAIPTTGQYDNTGKYYSSNSSWRVYQNENPQLTIKASEGFVIVSVKITYSNDNTGVLTLDGVNKTSDEVVNVNANSVVFSVGNTKSDVTNGNIQITAIEVVYKYACAHSNTEEREQVNATCTKDGHTAGTFCKDCESYVSGGEVIEALGHDYPTTWTSDGNGKHYKECGVCGEKDEKDCEYTLETVLANNANLCAPATCTSRATFYKVCECGHFNSDDQNVFESGSALGHIDEDGNNVCDREECKLPLCNGNHVASDYVVDGEYHYQVCTACHEEINRDKHSATSLNQGNDTQHWYVCDICDAEYGHENHQEEAGECACGKLIESKVINTIAGALVAEEGAEVNLNGFVSELYQEWSDQYNNMSFYLSDGSDTILIFGAPKLVYLGDTVNVVGVITVYKDTNQVAKNSTVTITKAHDCSFSEADCINASKCTICGKLNAEALGHADANKDGKCDRCDADLNAEPAGTITFDDKSKRTEYSTSKQVWEENGITVTNNKTNNSSNVADYAKPARFYKSSSLSIEYTAMTKIVFKCNADEYATALSNSITSDKYTVSANGKNVTVTFAEAADSFVISSLSGQVRMDGIEVYKTPAGGNSPEAQHTFGEWHDEIPATCVATGTKGYKQCTTCQKYFDAEGVEITDLTIAVDPNAHDLEHVDAQASTCTKQGWDAYEYCKREGCNHTTKELLPLAEHTPSAAVEENRVESTCTTQGSYDSVVYCSECNAELSRTKIDLDLDENAHAWVAGAVTAPTCTEDGYTTYTCECGDTYDDIDENSAQGHSFTKYTGTEATCLEDGIKTSKCDRCDAVDTKVTPALGHTDSNSDKICDTCQAALCNGNHTPAEAVKENVVDATCSNEGSYYSVVYCSVCHVQISKEQKTIDKLPHTEETIPAVDASCTKTGLTAGKECSVCGVITQAQEVVPAKGHNEVDIPAVDATCTETGLTAGKECSVCGVITKAQEEVPAKGHTPEVVEGKDATCTETGLTNGSKCSVCGEITKAQEEIPAKGHTGGEATCTEKAICDVCQAPYGDLAPHTPNKNVCECGYEYSVDEIISMASALANDTSLDGTYRLTGVITSVDTPYDTYYKNVTVSILVDGTEKDLTFKCYRMKGDGADKIGVGDTITVSGEIKNYEGIIEFDSGCALESYTFAQYEVKFETLGGGTISGIPAGTVARGSEFTIKVTPDEANNYVIDAVTVNGVAVPGTDGNYKITVNAESTVIAYFKKAGAGSAVATNTVTTNISEYATANNWTNDTKHTSITMDDNITASVTGGSNTGKYYTSGTNWRIYQTETPTLTISGGANVTILTVKVTYSGEKGGCLTYNGNIATGSVVDVNASTITFGVGNTGTATNGQVRVTAIEVTYKSNTATEGVCTHSEEKWGAWTIIKAATCTEMGVEMATCECGEIKTRYSLPINPNNHVYDKEVATEDYLVSGATCKDLAVYNKSCACGAKGDTTFTHGDYAQHTFGEWHDEIPATCVATGTKGYKQCTTCQNYFDAEGVEIADLIIGIDENAHAWVAGTTIAPTCTEQGYTNYTCSHKAEHTKKDNYVNALGHAEVAHEAKEPTCTEIGWDTYVTCSRCDHTTYQEKAALGHSLAHVARVEATCVANGNVEHWHCATCQKDFDAEKDGKEIDSITINALGHSLTHVARVEATCVANGNVEYWHCETCQKNFDAEEDGNVIDDVAIGIVEDAHDWVAGTTVAPTCTEQGYTNYTCSHKAEHTKKDDYVNALGHSLTHVARVEATCVANGNVEHWHCATCQKDFDAEKDGNIIDDVTIGIVEDAHDWSDWVVDVAATCTATGTSHRDCQREGCNKTESRTDGMISHVDLDHNNVCDSCLGSLCEEHTPGHMESDKDGHWYVCSECGFALEKAEHTEGEAIEKNRVESSCSEAGGYDMVVSCTVCNRQLSSTHHTLPLAEHTFGEWQTTTEASCTVDGAKRRDCVDCDAFETEVIKAEGHKHTAQETDPTCTDDGYTTYTCACGDAYIVVDKDSALGHKYDAVVTDPDCENGGYTTYTCSVCGDAYEANETSATGHNLNNVYVVEGNTLYTIDVCTVEGCDHTENKQEFEQEVAPVATESDLRVVLENGFNAQLTADVELTEGSIEITGKTVTVDLNGKTITANGTKGNACEAFYVREGANLTINGDGTVLAKNNGAEHVEALSAVDGAVVEINGGNFIAEGSTAIYATRGAEVTINGGSFKSDPYFGVYYTLDINEDDTLGQIIVKGGTYYNFDPANHTNDGSVNTNYLAEGYHSIADGDNYVVSAHSHSATVTAPTCTENGYTTYTCVCGDDYIVVDDDSALGHDEVAHEAQAPTCTEIGWDAYVTCSRCAHTTYQEKASLGHDMQTIDAQAPTCMAPGWNAYEYCKREGCDHNTKEELPIDEDAHSYSSSVTQPTCSTAGYTTYTCECGDTYTEPGAAATGHNYGELIAEIPATCTTNGTKAHYECSACHGLFNDDENKTATTEEALVILAGHSYTGWTDAVPATCTTNGTEGHYGCANCDKKFDNNYVEIANIVIPATGHKVTTNANDCDNCDYVLTAADIFELIDILESGETLEGTYALTGVVTEIRTAFNSQYGNVSVVIQVDDLGKTILCYRMQATDADAVVEGDKITVTGTIKNYNGTKEFDEDCTFVMVQKAQFTVSFDSVENGSISGVTSGASHERGTTISFNVSADEGYVVKSVKANGTACTLTDGTYSFVLTADTTITVEIAEESQGGEGTETTEKVVATFDFGANGTASHYDGTDMGASNTYTEGEYSLAITNASKVYTGARDAAGNSCLKLGTGSAAGSFTITVPDNVTSVIIYAAKYKAESASVTYNETTKSLSSESNNGAYDKLVIDTTSVKIINFEVTVGTRCMIDKIEFICIVAVCETCVPDEVLRYDSNKHWSVCVNCGRTLAESEHKNTTIHTGTPATCTTNGTTDSETCDDCGYVVREEEPITALGHSYDNTTGKCTVCGESKPAANTTKTVAMDIYANKGTTGDKTISWTSGDVTVTNNQGSSTNAIRTSDSDHYRLYAKSMFIINVNEGQKLQKIIITCTSSSYATALKNSFGSNAAVSGSVVTITFPDDESNISIQAQLTAQSRINKVEVTYIT